MMPHLTPLVAGHHQLDRLFFRHLLFERPIQADHFDPEFEGALGFPSPSASGALTFPPGFISPTAGGDGLGFTDFLFSFFLDLVLDLAHYRYPCCLW